jgi:hypothetical protein
MCLPIIWARAGQFWIRRIGAALISIKLVNKIAGGAMIRAIFSLVLGCAIAATSTTAMARSRHYSALRSDTYFWYPSNDPSAGFYNPAKDPNAVYSGGTYAGSDPDPNIRAALIRELGRRR